MDSEKLRALIQEKRAKVQNSGLALKDIRVIDLGAVVAAPYAATMLGDFGAEVIKVEPREVPDAIRFWSVVEGKYQPYWLVNSRNKLPITLNLKHPQGQKILRQLVEKSDVLLENMRPGTLDRLGFSARELWKINKGLIIGRISGFGQTGPYSAKPGFGTLAESMSGFSYLNTHPGQPPTNPPLPLADMVTGLHLALGVMIALHGRKRGSEGGQEIDLSLYEPLLGLLGPEYLHYSLTGIIPEPMGNEFPLAAPRNSFRTRDGKWVSLSASAQAPFERMMDLVGQSELKTKAGFRNNSERTQNESRQILNRVIGDWIGSKPLEDVMKECEKAGVTIGPVYNMEEISRDRHVKERGSIRDVREPVSGKTISFPANPIRLRPAPPEIQFPGLPMGAANEYVLQDLLGYAPEDVANISEAVSRISIIPWRP
ncbi:MAG: CoA transferase [Deltaproteobacteria bacterium]|nr:CoA transferase [Deltaproteobacteria bacterium]